jgi:hypothetical protein
MLFNKLATAVLFSPALASVIHFSLPSAQDVITEVDHLLHPNTLFTSLTVTDSYLDPKTQTRKKLCVLKALGNGLCDADGLIKATEICGKGGIIELPDAV